jgi:hypothetical protein
MNSKLITHQTDLRNSSKAMQVGSIMLNSNLSNDHANEMTDVDLSYSKIPDDQLLLDSFAQIGSLISSNENQFSQDGSRLQSIRNCPT